MSTFLFGVVFVRHTGVIWNDNFICVDPSHWILSVGDKFPDLVSVRDICLFLGSPNLLPPDKALSLYVKNQNDWLYRGHINNSHTSEVFPLQWPDVAVQNRDAQIGICVEALSEVNSREEFIVGSKGEFAKRVAMNLYTFMGSFQTTQNGNQLIVPANCFERWYTRFQEKFKRDPDFLTRDDTMI
eukprot:g1692.t1